VHDDYLSPEDRKILNFMFDNLSMSPRDVAKHFNIPRERVHDILARDLAEVMKG
jgi:DNA-directed RNA polymerase sigma subunit (sigma70/sigma32)